VPSCPATAGRPRFDLADIVRRHRRTLEAQGVTLAQRRVLSAIELCRTAALGGHVDVCRTCGYEHPAYNSCRNRHCPKCQALAQERWITARTERLLPVRHFHVVFTLPRELRELAKYRPREVYGALFSAAAGALLELAETRLRATLGITMVLHTWTRDLRFHPHVHAIVTAGGLSLDGDAWRASSSKYLFPVTVMGALLRGKMLAALSRLHARGTFEGFDSFDAPEAFARWVARLARLDWIVYAKKPFREALHVLRYLGRYTHRVAIANSRLLDVVDDAVSFRTKNGKVVTLAPLEFLGRFVQHVLPNGFHKIRHFGLYAGAQVDGALPVARALLTATSVTATPPSQPSWNELLRQTTGRDVDRCPVCAGPLVRIAFASPLARAPPRAA
jgi:hypothetical protein